VRTPSPNEAGSRPLHLTIAIALWGMAVWQFVSQLVLVTFAESGVDFEKHWIGARELVAGRSPYTGPENINLLGFNYPMFTAAAFAHLAAFDLKTAEFIWDATGLAAIVGSLWLFAVGLRPEATGRESRFGQFALRHWPALTTCMVVSFKPLQKALQCGNVDPLNLLLGSLLAYFFVKRRDRAAGLALAGFALVKVAPVLLVLPLAAMRRWRLLATFAAALAVYGVALLATGWWRHELFLVTEVLPALPFQWRSLSISVHKWLVSAFAPAAMEDAAAYGRWVSGTNAVLGSAFAALCAWRWKGGGADEELFLAFGYVMLLLISPLAEVIHLVWAIPAMILHLRAGARGAMPGWLLGFCMAAWFGAHWLDPLRWTRLARLFGEDWWAQTAMLAVLVAVAGAAAFWVRPKPALPPSQGIGVA